MYISLNWIKKHCPFTTTDAPRRIGERFSLATAEVEGVECRGEDLGRFVAARVLEVEEIDGTGAKLRRVEVDDGSGESVTVVCGAPNVRAGMVAPFVRPGTTVRGKRLESATIHGVKSSGMLLAEDEIGISGDHDELVELPEDVDPGTPLDTVYPEVVDVVLEIDNKSLTHRPDLWGHHGVAREFSTIYGAPLRPYRVNEALATASGDAGIVVSIAAGESRRRCRRYCGLRIDGVRVGPSPAWLRHRLLAVGARPINNIVDITNYILFDLGQPLHAFDCDRVQGGEIIVRMPGDGETLTLLDGRVVDLDPEDVVIADGSRPVALAGVMGGEDSEIADATVSIFLESANFDPGSVRRSSIRHGRTESSARFEKSLDPHQARLGILRAAELVLELCPGATVVGPLQDVGFEPPSPVVIELAAEFIADRLGADLTAQETRDILVGLGFDIVESQPDAADIGIGVSMWHVIVPSWRATRDVSIREDLVEEVGRIHGYDMISPRTPESPVLVPADNPRWRLERRIKTFLTLNSGLNEILTYSMVGEAHCKLFGLDPDAHLRLHNAMSEDLDRMRREIIPIHLEKTRENQRYFDHFGIFEVGRVYRKEAEKLRSPGLPDERVLVAGVLAFRDKADRNFYHLKQLVRGLVDFLQIDVSRFVSLVEPPPWAHPGVGADLCLGEAPAGSFYRVHPDTMDRLELRGDVLAFDLDFDALLNAPRQHVRHEPLPRYPGVPFDVAAVVPERTPAGDVLEVIRASGGPLLRDLRVFDVYCGAGVEEGKKSIAFQLLFRSDDQTLGAEEVESLQNAVIEGLCKAGYPLRQ